VSLNQSVKLYSRTGDDITKSFPEITSFKFNQNFSLDGELMAGEIKFPGTFNDLQQRLNRKSPSKEIIKTVPTFIIAYDILFLNSSDIRQKNLIERRKTLSQLLIKENIPFIKFSEEVKFKNFDELEDKRLKCRDEFNYEGLMLKLKNSIYQPGRPKGPWYKFKRDPFNVDVVLLYAQRGHGKRSSLYSDYTFGVWGKSSLKEELVTVGKAYSGFTDKELLKLDKFIRTKTINKFGPVREVEKSLVLEVSFDDIQKSKRHKSGLAMRFPRIKRIRWDKPANEADTLENLKKLVN
jgi:DNA ligase-1